MSKNRQMRTAVIAVIFESHAMPCHVRGSMNDTAVLNTVRNLTKCKFYPNYWSQPPLSDSIYTELPRSRSCGVGNRLIPNMRASTTCHLSNSFFAVTSPAQAMPIASMTNPLGFNVDTKLSLLATDELALTAEPANVLTRSRSVCACRGTR
jgi:hypothetical protein